jgi:16S rRNA (adenine1518-N6/adenine1519-N6)-dimethyltransferase
MRLVEETGVAQNDVFGQNFLVDENIINFEVEEAGLSSNDIVLEIGAGFGSVLDEIIKKSRAIAVEKDVKMFSYLINKYELNDRVKLINADILKMIIPYFNKVISNPPYPIVDRILNKLTHYEFESGIMILPNTISQRLSSEKVSNKFTLVQNAFFKFLPIMDVPKQAFYPVPRVTSKMVKIIRKDKDFLQSVLLKDDMTVKNALLRTQQTAFNKTKRESKTYFNGLDVSSLPFKDKEVKKLNVNELSDLIQYIKENYSSQ